MTAESRAARRAEVERDGRLLTAMLVHDLRQLLQGAVAEEVDPEHLMRLVDVKVMAGRDAHRRLTHMRINLRAERAAEWSDSRPLPDVLACYRHRGNYRGESRSMAALGVLLAPDTPAVSDPGNFAQDLHLRGEIWTFELEGTVHVFTTPGSRSDLVLARLRRSATDERPGQISSMSRDASNPACAPGQTSEPSGSPGGTRTLVARTW